MQQFWKSCNDKNRTLINWILIFKITSRIQRKTWVPNINCSKNTYISSDSNFERLIISTNDVFVLVLFVSSSTSVLILVKSYSWIFPTWKQKNTPFLPHQTSRKTQTNFQRTKFHSWTRRKKLVITTITTSKLIPIRAFNSTIKKLSNHLEISTSLQL